MFLFNLFGPEFIVLLFIAIFIFVIIMAIKALKYSFSKKNDNSNSIDKIGQLERLAALKEKGFLTDAEYQREKNKLL